MSAHAADVIREIDLAMETVAWSPLLVATVRHQRLDVREFNAAYSATLIGLALWLLVIPVCMVLTLWASHRRWERRQQPRGAQILEFRPRARG